ncbi:N-6 DNA methylase [symbiont of Argiope bruennichi]|uniref:hypothetical protein n=1 Tax=symbiont of Argiope bruennichi TaxID=2810479 RepID=UPI003DA63B26
MSSNRKVNFILDKTENKITEIFSKWYEKFDEKFKRVEHFELDKLNAAVLFYIVQSKLFEKYSKTEKYLENLELYDEEDEKINSIQNDFKMFYFEKEDYLFPKILEKANFYLKNPEDFRINFKKDFSEYFIDICVNLAQKNNKSDIFFALFNKNIKDISTIIANILIFYSNAEYDGEKIYQSDNFSELMFSKLIIYFSILLNSSGKGKNKTVVFSNKILVNFITKLIAPGKILNETKVYSPISDYGIFFVSFLEELHKTHKIFNNKPMIHRIKICPHVKTIFIKNLCSMILYLLDIDTDWLEDEKAIGDPVENDRLDDEKFDYIFADIPTEIKSWSSESEFELGEFRDEPSSNLPIYAWFIKVINKFAKNTKGACVIIFPYGSGSVKTMEENRKIFVEMNILDAIIKIPKGEYFGLDESKLMFILKRRPKDDHEVFISDIEYFLKYYDKPSDFFDIMEKIKKNYVAWTINHNYFRETPPKYRYGTIINGNLFKMNDSCSFRMEIFLKKLEGNRTYFDQKTKFFDFIFDHFTDQILFQKYSDEMSEIIEEIEKEHQN